MPGKILGIDITEHYLSAVQVMSGLKGYQIISCFSTPITDNNLEKALEELSNRFDLKSDKSILSIPPTDTSFRNVQTPFKDAKKIRQTLPFEIEAHVPFTIDERVIDYNHTDDDDPSSILTAAVNKSRIAGYIEKLKGVDVDPDIIDIRPVPAVIWLLEQDTTPDSGIYIDIKYKHPCIVIFHNKKIALIRELPCSFSEKAENSVLEKGEDSSSDSFENFIGTISRETLRTIHSFNSQSKNGFTVQKIFYGGTLSGHNDFSSILGTNFKIPAERINISRDNRLRMDPGLSGVYEPTLMDNALAVSIRENKKNIGFNFRRGEFAVKRKIFGPGKDIRNVAILLCILFVFMVVNSGVDYYYLNKKHSIMEEQFNKEFDNKIPEQKGTKGTNYRFLIVDQKLKELNDPSSDISTGIKPDQKVLDIWKDLSQRITDTYTFDVERIQITNREVTISGNTDSFDTVDKIANILKPSNFFNSVDIINPKQTKDGIKFELKLERAE